MLTASKIDGEGSAGDGVEKNNDDKHAKVRSKGVGVVHDGVPDLLRTPTSNECYNLDLDGDDGDCTKTNKSAAIAMESVSTYCVDSEAPKTLREGGLQAGWMQAAAAPYHVALCNVPALQQLEAAMINCCSGAMPFELNSKAWACQSTSRAWMLWARLSMLSLLDYQSSHVQSDVDCCWRRQAAWT